jgi:putative ABC transport system permease protein
MRILNRLSFLFKRARFNSDLEAEMRAHREMLEEQFVREGMPPDEARLAARRQLGGDLSAIEQSRDQWGFAWLDALLRDIAYALRLIRRRPALTLAAVLTVGLGVGANTAVVSVLQTALLNPLGLPAADEVLAATVRVESLKMSHSQTSGVEFRELSAMNDVFAAVAASEGRTWTASINGEPAHLRGVAVTPEFFRVFGQAPFAGRFFNPEDREAVVLSHRLWLTQFGGDAGALGRALILDGKPHRIVGVASPAFRFPASALAWTPLVLSPERLQRRGWTMNLALFARLQRGVSAGQAAQRVDAYVSALKSPDSAGGEGLTKSGYFLDLESFAHYVAGELRRPLWVLWAAALIVLFAGCANVSALLLSRVAGRRREMAIRLSLGATRFQILRQLLIESSILGLLGGLFGILTARFALSLLTRVSIPFKSILELVTLDQRLMLYGLGLALASGLLFGLAPASQLIRDTHAEAMKRGRRHRFQDLFVTAQAAAAIVLLVGAGLLLRSLWALGEVNPGFDSNNVTTAYVIKPEKDSGFLQRLEAALAAEPGVGSAALAFPLPFTTGGLTSTFTIKDRQRQPGEPEWHGEAYFVSPAYFSTLRIPLVRGRGLSDSDTESAPLVCVIDTRLAERFFPAQDPVGQRIAMYRGWCRIVGVVGAIHGDALDNESRPMIYYSLAQITFWPQIGVLARSTVPAGPLIRDAVRRSSSSAPVFDLRRSEDRIAESLGLRRVVAALVSVFGAICLLLAMVGLNGVIVQIIEERTPEIGIRIALGARPGQIMSELLRRGLTYAAAGVVIGLAASAYAQRWITGLLFRIEPFDPPAFVLACLCVLVILLLAILRPVRRASLIEPQSVLRNE